MAWMSHVLTFRMAIMRSIRHRLEILESVREELEIPIAALLDTKGPEIRTGILKDGKKVTLERGQTVYADDPRRSSVMRHDRLHQL